MVTRLGALDDAHELRLDDPFQDFHRNDFLALLEESRSYCAQDLRTSLDIIDVNRLPELPRNANSIPPSLKTLTSL